MKALKLCTVVSTLVLAGSMLLSTGAAVQAEVTTHQSVHAEKTNTSTVQSNVLDATESASGPGEVAAIQQIIVQTGVNINMNALLWNFPTDQLPEGGVFGDLSFLQTTPLAPLMDPAGMAGSLSQQPFLAPDPSVVEQFIEQSGMNNNVNVRVWDMHSEFQPFGNIDQSNILTATQTATGFKAIISIDHIVQQFGFNFNSTGLFTDLPEGTPPPSLFLHSLDFQQANPLIELISPDNGSDQPAAPFSLPGDPVEPTLLLSQTIIQTGINFNINILDVLSDLPPPTSADDFEKFFPKVTQTNVTIARQEATVVPEPASLALLMMGLSGLGAAFQLRRREAAVPTSTPRA